MKKSAILFLICLGGSLSHAQGVVTDLFECQTKLVDLKTNEAAESISDLAGVRMITPDQSMDYGTTMASTQSSLTLDGRRARYTVGMTLNYGFAVRPIPHSVEARQQVCNALSITICSKENNGTCSASATVCTVSPDPFDPKYGWSETTVNQGVPVFNEKLLRPVDTILPIGPEYPNGAHLTASCKLKGTFY